MFCIQCSLKQHHTLPKLAVYGNVWETEAVAIRAGMPLKSLSRQLVMTVLAKAVIVPLVLTLPTLVFAEGDFTLDQADGVFTVSAENTPLSTLVSRLSELTNIPMEIAGDLDTQVNISGENYSLESLISELTSSSMIIRKNINGEETISEVVFMLGSEANDAVAAALPSGEPNAGIISGDIDGADPNANPGLIANDATPADVTEENEGPPNSDPAGTADQPTEIIRPAQ